MDLWDDILLGESEDVSRDVVIQEDLISNEDGECDDSCHVKSNHVEPDDSRNRSYDFVDGGKRHVGNFSAKISKTRFEKIKVKGKKAIVYDFEGIRFAVPNTHRLADVLGNGNCGYYSLMTHLFNYGIANDINGDGIDVKDVIVFRKQILNFGKSCIDSITGAQGWKTVHWNVDDDPRNHMRDEDVLRYRSEMESIFKEVVAEHYENPFFMITDEKMRTHYFKTTHDCDESDYNSEIPPQIMRNIYNDYGNNRHHCEMEIVAPIVAMMAKVRIVVYTNELGRILIFDGRHERSGVPYLTVWGSKSYRDDPSDDEIVLHCIEHNEIDKNHDSRTIGIIHTGNHFIPMVRYQE